MRHWVYFLNIQRVYFLNIYWVYFLILNIHSVILFKLDLFKKMFIIRQFDIRKAFDKILYFSVKYCFMTYDYNITIRLVIALVFLIDS